MNFATLLALKLLSVWLHVDRYQRREAELREAALNKPIERSGSSSVRFVMAQELYIELDEYVVQLKSTLDYVARSPALVLGERGWCVDSFGDHGKLVIRTLNQSTPRSFRNSAKLLASIIEDNSQWLESLIAPSSSFRA